MSDQKTPRFTDAARQPDGGYVHSDYSDIRRTFARARSQLRQPGEDPLDPQTWIELQPVKTQGKQHD